MTSTSGWRYALWFAWSTSEYEIVSSRSGSSLSASTHTITTQPFVEQICAAAAVAQHKMNDDNKTERPFETWQFCFPKRSRKMFC